MVLTLRGEAKETRENSALHVIQQHGDQALLLQLVCKKCQRYWTAGGTMRYVLKAAAETADLQHPNSTNLLHTFALIQSSANQWHQG
ncbi:hypothetical protein HID58_042388 [Brassica napus]|uniref:Dof-type domain-containing protein n=1 Tax=Brassica napus TaxID=3708 RepID=A0ABQ8BDI7_BRANA|nr:hypothetical protein HID58_042388 [Brassica napus]